MKDDNEYVGADGRKIVEIVKADLGKLKGRFSEEMVAIVESVLLNEGEAVPTFIEVNERISMNLREQLVQAAAVSRSINSLFDEGYLNAPFKQQVPFDQGTYQPQNNTLQ